MHLLKWHNTGQMIFTQNKYTQFFKMVQIFITIHGSKYTKVIGNLCSFLQLFGHTALYIW